MNNNIFNLYNQLRQNPAQMLAQRFNLPQNMNLNNPNEILQYLLNSGQISQNQVNQANAMRQMFNQKQ